MSDMIREFPKMQEVFQQVKESAQTKYPFLSNEMSDILTVSVLNRILAPFNTQELNFILERSLQNDQDPEVRHMMIEKGINSDRIFGEYDAILDALQADFQQHEYSEQERERRIRESFGALLLPKGSAPVLHENNPTAAPETNSNAEKYREMLSTLKTSESITQLLESIPDEKQKQALGNLINLGQNFFAREYAFLPKETRDVILLNMLKNGSGITRETSEKYFSEHTTFTNIRNHLHTLKENFEKNNYTQEQKQALILQVTQYFLGGTQ